MKNIHVLPTDKPSKLFLSKRKNQFFLNEEFDESSPKIIAHHIYITSDEEIKEGDWYYLIDNEGYSNLFKKPLSNFEDYISKNGKKVILTTDQDLIKDGVQAVDDEFLEWFVKNPSCESVEVVKGFADGTNYGYNFLDYKIIIPKEEQKQNLIDMMQDDEKLGLYDNLPMSAEEWHYKGNNYGLDEFQQDEAYAKYFLSHYINVLAERMYSEDEVRAFAYNAFCLGQLDNPTENKFNGWFEQFKKK